jgi:hypothetical protein
MDREALLRYVTAKLAEAPDLAREKTRVEGKPPKHIKAYLRLRKHADSFLRGDTANRIVLLPGLRGVGKTTAVLQLYRYLTLKRGIDPSRILYFSADEMRNFLGASIYDIVKIYVEDFHRSTLPGLDTQLWVLVDEAHFDRKWDVSAKIIYDQSRNVFLLLTGSSALSIEMGVDLARRVTKEPVFPLNFAEHLIFKYGVYPPRGTAEVLRKVIFQPTPGIAERLAEVWADLRRRMLSIGKPLERELEHYLTAGGFPFCVGLGVKNIHSRLFDMVGRIVEKDVLTTSQLRSDTRSVVTRIIYYLAQQKPGGVSDVKLAGWLEVSSRSVRNIMEMLEKTHLVFSVRPYGGAGRVVRSAWKYYFQAPSINAALRSKLGTYHAGDREYLGLLAETMVASCFFRIKETAYPLVGIFYDPAKRGADFILQTGPETLIPVEVSVGEKGESQVRETMRKCGAEYGVVISGEDGVFMEKEVLHIPLTFFGFC